MLEQAKLQEIVSCFALEGDLVSITPFGSGHINDTYRVVMQEKVDQRRYIL